jgi:two-component system, chemotaxis family, sensor kinase Cph1
MPDDVFGGVLQHSAGHRTAEENLGAIAHALDHSNVIVRQWNGLIEHWTSGCANLYGWTSDEAVGKIVHQLLKTNFPAPLEQIQQQLLLSGAWKGELEHLKRDGTHVFVSTHWVLMTDSSDEPPSVIETHSDITARLQIQRELEYANERLKSMAIELERSNEELEEFARIASHDLSAPITSTRWLADLLATRHAEGLDENGRRCVHQITQGLDRMADLVEAVLAHARVGKSSIAAEKTSDVADALRAARENLRRHIETSGATVEHGALPQVYVETHALNQLFQNLLSNSIKYRRQDLPPVIGISAEWTQGEWLLSVRDNGIGIEPEWHERIFQPLQRRHGMEIAGSGIGLATCKKIVTRAGGNIWVESEPGGGSTFFFTLPGPPPA